MQAFKDLCSLCFKISRVVQDLSIGMGPQSLSDTQASLLQQLTLDLRTASSKLAPTPFKTNVAQAPLSTEHQAQLISSLSTLMSAVVTQLNALDTAATSRSGYGSATPTAFTQMFTQLWNLLYHVCDAFGSRSQKLWPCLARSEYKASQKAMYSLLECLLRVLRSSSHMWRIMLDGLSISARHDQLAAMLSVPLTYLHSISAWPVTNLLSELATLPPPFITMLCCVMLELQGEFAKLFKAAALAAENSEAAVAAAEEDEEEEAEAVAAAVLEEARQYMQGFGLPMRNIAYIFMQLGASFDSMCDKLIRIDDGIFLEQLSTPAVIQFYKTLLFLYQDQPDTALPFKKNLTNQTLANLLATIMNFQLASEGYPSMQVYLQAFGERGLLYDARFTTSFDVSDIQLMRLLFDSMPPETDRKEQSYQLILALVQSWEENSHSYPLMPLPSAADQGRGVYMTLHHCALRVIDHQQQQQQQQQQPAAVIPTAQLSLAEGIQDLIVGVYKNSSTLKHLSELQSAIENSSTPSRRVLQTAWGSGLMALRDFHHLPGSILMIELSLRDFGKRPVLEIFQAVQFTSDALRQSVRSDDPATLSACISLAATMQKLLTAMLHPISGTPKLQPDQQQRAKRREQEGRSELDYGRKAIMYGYYRVIWELNHAMTEESHVPTGIASLTQNESGVSDSDRLSVAASTLKKRLIHQLIAVVLVSLLKTCLPVAGRASQVGSARDVQLPWFGDMMVFLDRRMRGRLGYTLKALFEGRFPTFATSQGWVDSIWEEYAVVKFGGRLVPGCCYLGCTNLVGMSEAGLKTQLCSGCRRAKYCCVECQKAAWVKGGHSAVCQK